MMAVDCNDVGLKKKYLSIFYGSVDYCYVANFANTSREIKWSPADGALFLELAWKSE